MRIRHHPHTPAAVLLAGIAALAALLGGGGGAPWAALQGASRAPVAPALPAPGSTERKAFDECRHNVSIVHDVYWASACTVLADEHRQLRSACMASRGSPQLLCPPLLEPVDDSPECTLPDDRAASLNAARAQAEQECLDEATASPRITGRAARR
jgi:hypothetical protein